MYIDNFTINTSGLHINKSIIFNLFFILKLRKGHDNLIKCVMELEIACTAEKVHREAYKLTVYTYF